MRARNIKPGFFKNEQLPDCDPLARLLFIGLWCMADKRGRMEDRPRKIKLEILPCDNCDIEALLEQLQSCGFICRYEVGGRRYIQVINFDRHQHPHHKEPDSMLPAPDLDVMLEPSITHKPQARPRQAPEKADPSPSDSLIPDSLIPESSLSSDDAHPREAKHAKPKKQIPNLSRLPFDSLPPEWAEWVHAEMGWNAGTTADVWLNFRDYWQGKLGKSACKSDWGATWRNWCRRQIIRNSGAHHATAIRHPTQGARPSKSERFKQALVDSTCEELSVERRPGGDQDPV